jgi:toxin-antitoxin system PIN domain toxin
MSVALLDVNCLIAMAWPNHVQHATAKKWFKENKGEGWATCPITQAGFVRISSTPSFSEEAVSPLEALQLLDRILRHPDHRFWPDTVPLTHEKMPRGHLMGHRQVTDMYLLGLAIHHGGRLVTLDHGIENLLPHNSPLRKHLFVIRQ